MSDEAQAVRAGLRVMTYPDVEHLQATALEALASLESQNQALQEERDTYRDMWLTDHKAFEDERAISVALQERIEELEGGLWQLKESQPRALRYIRLNGFKWPDKNSIGIEPGNWQHLAFSLYSDLCEVDSLVGQLLSPTRRPDPE